MDNNLSSVHTAAEIPDMRSTIDDIQKILQTIPFDEDVARQKICETNAKHPDNKMIWNLLHANVPSGVSIQQASKENLCQDLQWKAYGFRPNRSSMICCPFHADRNPSMKVDSRFHCFGCGADGDVIDFAAKLFQLSLRQAAEKLATDFGLSATGNSPRFLCKPVEKPLSPKEQLYKILCSYRALLANWRITYVPQNPEETLHPCFVASMHYAERVQYLLDILLQGSSHEKQLLLNGKEVTALGKAIERYKETEAAT